MVFVKKLLLGAYSFYVSRLHCYDSVFGRTNTRVRHPRAHAFCSIKLRFHDNCVDFRKLREYFRNPCD